MSTITKQYPILMSKYLINELSMEAYWKRKQPEAVLLDWLNAGLGCKVDVKGRAKDT